MPKVPKKRVDEYLDPESQKHTPNEEDIRNDLNIRDRVLASLDEIFLTFESKRRKFVDEEQEYIGERRTPSPESIWNNLSYIQEDLVGNIKDPDIREELNKKILEVDKLVLNQYIPFMESEVARFGRDNSPLETGYKDKRADASNDIDFQLEEALIVLRNTDHISREETVHLLIDLERIKERYARYTKEATLYTYEKLEIELQKSLSDEEFAEALRFAVIKNTLLSNKEAQEREEKMFEKFLSMSNRLSEISNRMMDNEIRKRCQLKARSLTAFIEFLSAQRKAPEKLFVVKAELDDIFQTLKKGQSIDIDRLQNIKEDLDNMRIELSGGKYNILGAFFDNLDKTYSDIERIRNGDNVRENTPEIDYSEIDWAWSTLGVKKGSSMRDVTKAYRSIALKYHPDINKDRYAMKRCRI